MTEYFDQTDDGEFRDWYAMLAKRLGLAPNPDDPEHYYDYRALWEDVKAKRAKQPDAPGGHFPSKYKKPGHPRAFLKDTRGKAFDTKTATYLSGEPVSRRELVASEQSPDMPGFDPELAKQMTLVASLFRLR